MTADSAPRCSPKNSFNCVIRAKQRTQLLCRRNRVANAANDTSPTQPPGASSVIKRTLHGESLFKAASKPVPGICRASPIVARLDPLTGNERNREAAVNLAATGGLLRRRVSEAAAKPSDRPSTRRRLLTMQLLLCRG